MKLCRCFWLIWSLVKAQRRFIQIWIFQITVQLLLLLMHTNAGVAVLMLRVHLHDPFLFLLLLFLWLAFFIELFFRVFWWFDLFWPNNVSLMYKKLWWHYFLLDVLYWAGSSQGRHRAILFTRLTNLHLSHQMLLHPFELLFLAFQAQFWQFRNFQLFQIANTDAWTVLEQLFTVLLIQKPARQTRLASSMKFWKLLLISMKHLVILLFNPLGHINNFCYSLRRFGVWKNLYVGFHVGGGGCAGQGESFFYNVELFCVRQLLVVSSPAELADVRISLIALRHLRRSFRLFQAMRKGPIC